MSAAKAGAKEIAERIDEELVDLCYEVDPKTFRAECERIISSALEARECDMKELYATIEAPLATESPYMLMQRLRQIRTALAKLRAGEQKGTE